MRRGRSPSRPGRADGSTGAGVTTGRAGAPPAWGWKTPDAGRAAHVAPGMEYQGTTVQLCGLFPFIAGSGAPALGVPIGRHMLWGEVVCLDPLEWLRAGLVTNPGVFVLGQPGVGKSTIVKRLITGHGGGRHPHPHPGRHQTRLHRAREVPRRAGHPGRTRPGPDQPARLRTARRGAAAHVRRGRATAAPGDPRPTADACCWPCAPWSAAEPILNSEEVVLGRAVDMLTDRRSTDPTVPDVLRPASSTAPTNCAPPPAPAPTSEYRRRVERARPHPGPAVRRRARAASSTAPTTTPIDLDAPAVTRRHLPRRRRRRPARRRGDAVRLGLRVRHGRRRRRPGRPRAGAAPAVPGSHGRAVAGAARSVRAGRARRRADPPQPAARHGLGDGHPLPGRPGRPAHRGGPGQGPGLRRTRRHQGPGRPAARASCTGSARWSSSTEPERDLVAVLGRARGLVRRRPSTRAAAST